MLPNLILGENAFPEYVQDEANGATLAQAVAALLDDGPERRRQIEALAKIAEKMLLPGGETPSGAAAEAIRRYGGVRAPLA